MALQAAAEDCDGAGAGRRRAVGARAHPAGGQHPGRGAARLALGQPGPAGGPASRLRRRRRAGGADGLGDRGQRPPGPHARCLPRHQPRRARRRPDHRSRGHVRPGPGSRATRPARGSSGRTSRPRARAPPVVFGVDKPGATRPRDEPRRAAPRPRLPPVRERPPRRQRMDPRRARRPHRGPVVALQRRGRGQPARVDPHAPQRRRDRHTRAGQPDGLAPLSEAVHRQHAGRPGGRPASCARRRRPAPPVCPRSAGSSRSPGADANDHWFISERPELHRSPAIRLAGAAALEAAGLGIDDVASIDLYSCFPAVVQMAAAELGLAVDDPARPLTLTGGLTFGGGPGNNYTSHGIARAVGALREAPGSTALVTGLGLVRHQALRRDLRRHARRRTWRPAASPGATSSPRSTRCPGAGSTPRRPGRFAWRPTRSPSTARARPNAASSPAGPPTTAAPGAMSTDRDALALLCAEEGIGRTGVLAADGMLSLDG